jgi:predicted nucleic-acid-binding protein
MSYLIDTNILLRSAQPDHPMFTSATQAVNTLLSQGEEIYITSKNIIEFWNVATRPLDKNGLGYSLNKTNKEISKL